MSIRCRWPPENWIGHLSIIVGDSPTSSKKLATRSRCPRRLRATPNTFSDSLMICVIVRRVTRPSVGSMRRNSSFPSGDFPHPDSPNTASVSSGAMVKLTPSTGRAGSDPNPKLRCPPTCNPARGMVAFGKTEHRRHCLRAPDDAHGAAGPERTAFPDRACHRHCTMSWNGRSRSSESFESASIRPCVYGWRGCLNSARSSPSPPRARHILSAGSNG
jgi:hypothetical protein